MQSSTVEMMKEALKMKIVEQNKLLVITRLDRTSLKATAALNTDNFRRQNSTFGAIEKDSCLLQPCSRHKYFAI